MQKLVAGVCGEFPSACSDHQKTILHAAGALAQEAQLNHTSIMTRIELGHGAAGHDASTVSLRYATAILGRTHHTTVDCDSMLVPCDTALHMLVWTGSYATIPSWPQNRGLWILACGENVRGQQLYHGLLPTGAVMTATLALWVRTAVSIGMGTNGTSALVGWHVLSAQVAQQLPGAAHGEVDVEKLRLMPRRATKIQKVDSVSAR